MTSPLSPIEVGEVIADKFRIERVLGRGGNGIVVQAIHLQLGERVALKFVQADDAERVVNEARACLRLKTEHVARVMDVGRYRGSAFIVMEYLEGKDLEKLLEENGRLEDSAEAVELVVQVCEAVAEAHRAGIVHRDIKLANLFLVASRTAMPLVKLLDFGIATSAVETAADDAKRAPLVGSLHYMAPEALQGATDDPRVDIWSLGVVLFELLTGWKPFESKDVVSLMAEIHEAAHLSLRSFRADLPEALEDVINRCLEKDPEARFATVGELAMALFPFAPERTHLTIDRAVRFSTEHVSSSSMVAGSSNAPRSGARSSSPRMASGGATTLRKSGSRTNKSVPSLTSTSPGGVDTRGSKVSWYVAAVALLALASVFVLHRSSSVKRSTVAATVARPAEPPPPAPQATVVAEPAAPMTPTTAASVAPVSTPSELPRRAPVAAPRPAADIRAAAAAKDASVAGPRVEASSAASSTKSVELDPWRSSKPKLEDNPFK